ncbi:hypothetical protein BACINT_01175 [Bacteroides intestinalis DSM 17393]|uniref:KilA-N DNA-binding domain-containing protein n=2 Tax=Bacteroides intestinalis TaxID=329854 RepID=B3C9L1_9BACE|nr:hypothetical protein BACINT_01175 [Bacteroides intestinalis DSM 17393]
MFVNGQVSAQKRTLQETNKKMRKPLFKVKIPLPLLETTIIMELQVIQNKIYEFRGQKIMFDFDLAQLYGVETAQLKRSVKRNMERFEGEDFMFEVTREELVNVSKLWHNLFYAQSPDFRKPGLCYSPKFLYL